MPSTKHGQSSASALPETRPVDSFLEPAPAAANAVLDLSPESRARLDALLRADVVELGKVCDEIRSVPSLESVVVKLGASVALLSSPSPAPLQEAIVLLGADRLRVLIDAWPLLPPATDSDPQPEPERGGPSGDASSRVSLPRRSVVPATPPDRFAEACNPENLYFASLANRSELLFSDALERPDVRSVTRFGLHHEQIEGLADMFVRDFVALAPLIEPAASASRRQQAIPAGSLRSSRRTSE